jgi:hypothetical protein
VFDAVVFDAVVVLGDVAALGGELVFGAALAGALVEDCGVSVVVVLGLCARKGTMA